MHFSLIVIGNGSIRDMMAPYSENLEVPEYCYGPVSESDIQRMIDYYNENTRGRHYAMRDFDELYAEHGKKWNDNRWRKGEDGVWREFSNYNPESRWDWYEVGGRWAGQLQVKDGVETAPVNFSWGWSDENKKTVLNAHPKRADIARKGDILNIDELMACSVLKDGVWYDKQENDNDTPEERLNGMYVAPFLEDVADDTIITCIDYHI